VVDNEGDKGKLLQFAHHLIPKDGFTLISVSTNQAAALKPHQLFTGGSG